MDWFIVMNMNVTPKLSWNFVSLGVRDASNYRLCMNLMSKKNIGTLCYICLDQNLFTGMNSITYLFGLNLLPGIVDKRKFVIDLHRYLFIISKNLDLSIHGCITSNKNNSTFNSKMVIFKWKK